MPQNTHLELVTSEAERLPELPETQGSDSAAVRLHATKLAQNLPWLPNTEPSTYFIDRFSALAEKIYLLLSKFEKL